MKPHKAIGCKRNPKRHKAMLRPVIDIKFQYKTLLNTALQTVNKYIFLALIHLNLRLYTGNMKIKGRK